MDLELILRWAAMLIEAVQQRRQVNSKRSLSVRSFGYFFIEAIRRFTIRFKGLLFRIHIL